MTKKKAERWLICGGRNFIDFRFIVDTLDNLVNERGVPDVIIHGDCGTPTPKGHGQAIGADKIADEWATFHGYPIMKFPAPWNVYQKAAGHLRNGVMIKVGRPTFAVAFKGNQGTANMISQLIAAGIDYVEPHKEK